MHWRVHLAPHWKAELCARHLVERAFWTFNTPGFLIECLPKEPHTNLDEISPEPHSSCTALLHSSTQDILILTERLHNFRSVPFIRSAALVEA